MSETIILAAMFVLGGIVGYVIAQYHKSEDKDGCKSGCTHDWVPQGVWEERCWKCHERRVK